MAQACARLASGVGVLRQPRASHETLLSKAADENCPACSAFYKVSEQAGRGQAKQLHCSELRIGKNACAGAQWSRRDTSAPIEALHRYGLSIIARTSD